VKKKSYTARDTPKEEVLSPQNKLETTFLNVPSNNFLKVPTGHYVPSAMSKKQSSLDNKTFNNIRT
jgi:hypothetical protein